MQSTGDLLFLSSLQIYLLTDSTFPLQVMLLNICTWLNIDKCFHLKWNFCFTLIPDITLPLRGVQPVNVKCFPLRCGLKFLEMCFWSVLFNSFEKPELINSFVRYSWPPLAFLFRLEVFVFPLWEGKYNILPCSWRNENSLSSFQEGCWRSCSLFWKNKISSTTLQYTCWGFDYWLL